MKQYPTYKDSGVQWIGQIPEHWSTVKTKYIAKLYTGNSLDDSQKAKYSTDPFDMNASDTPYIATKDISSDCNCVSYYNGMTIPQDEAGFKRAPQGSFLLCIEGGSAGKKHAYLEHDVCFVNKLCCFDTDLDSRYHYYFIQSTPFTSHFQKLVQGLIGGVSVSDLNNMEVLVPSPAEQQAIAKFLDEKTAEIDESIALYEDQKADLIEYRKALISDTVTHGLNSDAPKKDSGVQWIGQIPEGWGLSALKYLGDARNGLTYSPEDVKESGILVLRSSNIQDSQLAYEDNVYVDSAPENLKMKMGDILICSRNGSIALVGKCAYIPEDMDDAVFGAFMLRYRPTNPNRYIFYAVQEAIRNYKAFYATSTVNQLTVDVFGKMQIPLPSFAEQQEIVKFLDNKTSKIDDAISRIDEQIADLRAYRTALITDAVTGKIDVRTAK